MSRQVFIPGFGAYNETGRRQVFIPGLGAYNETQTNNYSDSISESVTASDSLFAPDTLNLTISESLTAADAFTAVALNRQYFWPGFGVICESGQGGIYFVPGAGVLNDTSPRVILPGVYAVMTTATSDPVTSADGVTGTNAVNAQMAENLFASDVPPYPIPITSLFGRALFAQALFASGNVVLSSGGPSGSSSLFGRALPGASLFAGGSGSNPSPTFKYPYIAVVFRPNMSETITGALALTTHIGATVPAWRTFKAKDTRIFKVSPN